MPPVRWLDPVLAATVNPTVPFPVPVAPELTVMKFELLTAVHGQVPVAATLTIPVLPDAPKFWLVGFKLKLWMLSVAGNEMSVPQALETRTS